MEKEMREVASYAERALLYEVTCTPKPGLVDAVDAGAHEDMDIFTFIKSSCVLRGYFEEFFKRGYQAEKELPLPELFEQIRQLGLEAEQAMYQVTLGVNTHKGAIFSLGILLCATGYVHKQNTSITVEKVLSVTKKMLIRLSTDFKKLDLAENQSYTAGEQLYLKYGISGIRGEASAGYPLVYNYALPFLKKSKGTTHERMLDTLLYIVTLAEDTNLIKRGGSLATLFEVRKKIKNYFDHGGSKSDQGKQDLATLNQEFKDKNLSIGGSADLLIVTLYFFFLEGNDLANSEA